MGDKSSAFHKRWLKGVECGHWETTPLYLFHRKKRRFLQLKPYVYACFSSHPFVSMHGVKGPGILFSVFISMNRQDVEREGRFSPLWTLVIGSLNVCGCSMNKAKGEVIGWMFVRKKTALVDVFRVYQWKRLRNQDSVNSHHLYICYMHSLNLQPSSYHLCTTPAVTDFLVFLLFTSGLWCL